MYQGCNHLGLTAPKLLHTRSNSFRVIITSKPFAACSLHDIHLDAHHAGVVLAIHVGVLAVEPIAKGRKTISLILFLVGGKFRALTVGAVSSVRIVKLSAQVKTTPKNCVIRRSEASVAIR